MTNGAPSHAWKPSKKRAQQLGTLARRTLPHGKIVKRRSGAAEQIRTQTARLNTELAEQESRLKRAGEKTAPVIKCP
jgi:hypothetical protein